MFDDKVLSLRLNRNLQNLDFKSTSNPSFQIPFTKTTLVSINCDANGPTVKTNYEKGGQKHTTP